MRVTQYRIEGLGHLSTLVADEAAGTAAVVDPRRDVDVYLEAARAAGLRISHVFETHLHNDYVSGGRDLAALTGATHVIGAGAELAHEHRPVRDGEALEVGTIRFRALDTPGHTPEHVSYAVSDTSRADEPFLLLTGGSLLVGAVGRTDLLGAEHARAYAADMYHSLHDVLLRHEESVMVYPTHGAGSLCSTGISSTSWSTIGYERRHDPLLGPMEIDAFARALLSGQPTVPRYFARMRPTEPGRPARCSAGSSRRSRRCPATGWRAPSVATRSSSMRARRAIMPPTTSRARCRSRPARRSGRGSAGWPNPTGRSSCSWRTPPTSTTCPARRCASGSTRSSATSTAASTPGDVAGARSRPASCSSVETLAARLAAGGPEAPFVIDVRQLSEYEAGHVPGSTHIGAGELPEMLDRLPRDRPIATICASGYRTSVAASMLRAAGFEDVATVSSGVPTWEAHGFPVEYGPGSGSGDWPAATATAGEAHQH